MQDLPITGFDMAVIGVIFISGLIAFARGFIRETLSIAAFIAAALAALWSYPALREAARGAVSPSWLADMLVIVGIFLAVYVAVTMVTSSITNLIHRNERVGFFDRMLGFVFGVARGLVLAGLALITYNAAVPEEEWGDWLTGAVTYPMVNKTARAMQALAPQTAWAAANTIPPVDANAGGRGYAENERNALDALAAESAED